MKELTLEQKIIEHLAKKGYITNVGDVTRALQDVLYADKMITAQGKDGLKDDIEDAILSLEILMISRLFCCNHIGYKWLRFFILVKKYSLFAY